MGVVLNELIKQVDSRNIKIVAGKKGLSNIVEWVHMVDSIEIAEFMTGGEIAFTTGLGINENMSVLDLVKSIYKQGASGIVINVGPYIDKIEQAVIDFGNEHDFPIFEVPWRVHMADIMRLFSGTITSLDQKAMELSAAFKNAIFSPKMEELYVPVLMQKGYFPTWNYVVAVIDISMLIEKGDEYEYVPLSSQRYDVVKKKLERKIVSIKSDVVTYVDKDKLLLVFSDINEPQAETLVINMCDYLKSILKPNELYFASVGKTSKHIRDISSSYTIAHRIVELMKIESMEDEVKTYSKTGIAKMLLNLSSFESLDDYYEETIQPLDEYDENNSGNLVETLESYLYHNGSVQDTAEELFVHRNTVNYKLKKIESILNVNITDFKIRNDLMTGILVKKIRQIKI